jgi:beta-glucosidase
VGYRWYDSKGIAPLFPFGYGLSYTTFRFSGLQVRGSRRGAWVSFTLRNTGRRRGADVAQVYVGDPHSTGEPPRQLKGFQKVWLDPGQSSRLRIWLPEVSFAHWGGGRRPWVVSRGVYRVYVGDSSALGDLPLRQGLRRVAARLPGRVY